MSKTHVKLTINGNEVEVEVEPRTLLIHFLQEHQKLKGPHIGCDTGHCDTCTIKLNGKSVKSCMIFTVQADGSEIITIEGISNPNGTLYEIQDTFH